MGGERDTGLAYILLLLGGMLGIHKFYLNKPAWGILYFFTGGLIFIGVIYDFFTLPGQVDECNAAMGYGRKYPRYCRRADFDRYDEPRSAALRSADQKLQDFDRRLNNLEAVINAKRN